MTKKARVTLFLIILLLLLIGWSAFYLLTPTQSSQDQKGFREWFWHYRSFDLLTQVVLIFAGALAITALLPPEEKND